MVVIEWCRNVVWFDLICWVLNIGFWILGFECWVLNIGFRVDWLIGELYWFDY